MKPTILIVDDYKDTRELMGRALDEEYSTVLAPDAEGAMKALAADPSIALMLSDVRMPGTDGVTLLKTVKATYPELAVILLTAYGTVDLAVEAMKEGADDFLTKPVDLDQLEMRVKKVLETRRLKSEVADLHRQLDEKYGMENIIGESPAMKNVFRRIRQAAPSDATVLISGPSGTGKELVAHAIHQLSPRAKGPFVPVHCAALSRELLESELFGHERGAFTDARDRRIGRAEAADGGTLFLDEIGDLPLPLQVKLLRFLQDRTFSRVGSSEERHSDVRFLAATSRNLEDMMSRGLFREDLYYRINIFPIALPPLSTRGDDVLLLARHFLARLSAKYGKTVDRISPPAADILLAHPWPGNVRELENCIERAVLTAQDDCIHTYNLPPALRDAAPAEDPAAPGAPLTLAAQLAAHERQILSSALRRHNGNRSAAGRELGVTPRMMTYRLAKAGLS